MVNDKIKFPFSEKKEGEFVIRKFLCDVEEVNLVWHRDNEDRYIFCDHKTDWMFQRENELPINFDPTTHIFIKKNEWHRLIKGSNDLTLKILKN